MQLINLDELEETLSRNTESLFWIPYVIVPIFAGFLAYHSVDNELYSPERHLLIASHEISDEYRSATVYDEWKDKRTARIYTPTDFIEHRQSEALRMTYTWFLYGLIGCGFYSIQRSRFAGQKVIPSFCRAVIVDSLVALYIYISMRGI
jgi:hypothetical protein